MYHYHLDFYPKFQDHDKNKKSVYVGNFNNIWYYDLNDHKKLLNAIQNDDILTIKEYIISQGADKFIKDLLYPLYDSPFTLNRKNIFDITRKARCFLDCPFHDSLNK